MRRTVLIVDDKRPIVELLQTRLEYRGLETVACSTLGAAQEEWEHQPNRFTLAIIDHHLPDGVGSHFAAELGLHMPVLVTSGVRTRFLQGTRVEVLEKPFALRSVTEWVERALAAAGEVAAR